MVYKEILFGYYFSRQLFMSKSMAQECHCLCERVNNWLDQLCNINLVPIRP